MPPDRWAGGSARRLRVMDEETARQLVQQDLVAGQVVTGVKRVSNTWVVTWAQQKYLETGDFRWIEAGPSHTYLVSDRGAFTRTQGTTRSRATSRRQSLEEQIAEFERQRS